MFPVHQNLISGAREDSLCLCVWEGGGGGYSRFSHEGMNWLPKLSAVLINKCTNDIYLSTAYLDAHTEK